MPQQNNIAILQARMGSSRLPGKMMMPLAGKPLIDYAMERLFSAVRPDGGLDAVVLATSMYTNNDSLVDHVKKRWPQVIIVRGPEEDVLARFVSSIRQTGAKVVVRTTGDCPFINVESIHRMIGELVRTKSDAVNYQPGYEYVDKGLEAVSAEALLRVSEDAELTPQDREHVTSLMYRLPDRYRIRYIESDSILRRGDIRLTIDTADDLRFMEALIPKLPADPGRVSLAEIVSVIDQHPDISVINAASGRKCTLHERARLGFRCDGNTEIGLGHLVGSIRLATLLARELGIGVEFVVKENHAAQSLIKQAGFSMEVLPGAIKPEKDISRLIEKKSESMWSGIVFNFCKDDLERYTSHFNAIKDNNISLVFMDNPLPPSYHLADLLINALPHPVYEGYKPENHPNCLDGLEYFIPGFEGQPPDRLTKPTVDRVLIAMGGADNPNLTEMVVKALVETDFKGYVDVVLGSACPHLESVQKSFEASGLNGAISQNISDLYKRMHLADLGFSGLGLTTYEMAYTGLPALIISGSQLNENAAEQYVQTYGAAEHIGFYRNIDQNHISSCLSKIMSDMGKRLKLSRSVYRVGQKMNQIVLSVSSVLNLSKPENSKQEMTD